MCLCCIMKNRFSRKPVFLPRVEDMNGTQVAKTQLSNLVNSKSSPASGIQRKYGMVLLGCLLLLALGVRLFWQSRGNNSPPAPPSLAMDDAGADLPLSPPPVPPDNAAALRAAHAGLDALPPNASPFIQQQAAETALEIGDLWQGESLSRTILRQAPANRAARLSLAESLRRQARFVEAEDVYLPLLKADARDSDAYLGLADTEFAANHRPQAFVWLARGVRDGAQTALALTTFAHRYQDWKDYPKAEATALRAVQIAPSDMAARLQLASAQVESSNLDAGRNTLEDILQRDPNNGLARRLLGVVLMNAAYAHADINRARMLLEQAVELNPKDMDIYRAAAVIYRQQHLYRLAAQAYNTLLILDPTSLDGRYGLGQVYALLGKPEQSKQQLAAYRQLEEQQRRVARLSEEVTHQPENATVHAALAGYLVSRGDFARAAPEYQTAAGLAPNNAEIQTGLAQLYARLGWTRPEHKSP